ncbi:MAG: glycosyltransferase family 2 protein [Acidimicrobiia bacterium]|nr:glycosyltransferase family 2 protein [Acidimicrobiia bacterium]
MSSSEGQSAAVPPDSDVAPASTDPDADLRAQNAQLRAANQRLRERLEATRSHLTEVKAKARPDEALSDDRALLRAGRRFIDAGEFERAHRALAIVLESAEVGPKAGAAMRRLAALAEQHRHADLELLCRVDLILSGHGAPTHLKRAMTICSQQESDPKLVVLIEWLMEHEPATVRDTLNGVYLADLSNDVCAYLVEVCERLAHSFPDDGRLQYRRAELQDQLGQTVEANERRQQALALFIEAEDPDPEQHFYTAVAALACGERVRARDQFEWLCDHVQEAPTRAGFRHLDHLFRLVGEPSELLSALDGAASREPDPQAALMMAELRVVVGDVERAADDIAALVDLDSEDLPYQESLLAAWLHARRGDLDAARRCHLRTVWPKSDRWFNALGSDSLRYLAERPGRGGPASTVAPGGLPVFAVLKNERPRIEAFLEHYRGLGATTFFMVDNDSTDGGLELLQTQPDVHCFHTSGGIRQSHYGVRWLNHLMQLHAPDHWVLTADLDEHLVYRGSDDGTDLTDLIARLEGDGAMMLRTFMLGLFPASAADIRAPTGPTDLVETHRYFDADYRGLGMLDAPYGDVIGGARRRIGTPPAHPTLVKTPMFHTGEGIQMNCVTHTVSPGTVASEGGVLLHYKFAADPLERSRYSSHSPQENWAHRFFEANDLRGPASVEFTGASQLEELGLFDVGSTARA